MGSNNKLKNISLLETALNQVEDFCLLGAQKMQTSSYEIDIISSIQSRMKEVDYELQNHSLYEGIDSWLHDPKDAKLKTLIDQYDVQSIDPVESLQFKNIIFYGYIDNANLNFLKSFQNVINFDVIYNGIENPTTSPQLISTFVDFIRPGMNALIISPYDYIDPEKEVIVSEYSSCAFLLQK
ncbi:MAG: hypothetical protein ACQESE_05080 [Nanobdellota archaeon]